MGFLGGLGYFSNTVFVSTLIYDFILYDFFYSDVLEHYFVVGAMYNEAIAQGLHIFFIWPKFAEKCSQSFNFSKYVLFAR